MTISSRVTIPRTCHARGSPEQWLNKFEQVMMSVVKQCVKAGVESYTDADKQQWSLQHPGQAVLTVVGNVNCSCWVETNYVTTVCCS